MHNGSKCGQQVRLRNQYLFSACGTPQGV